MQWTSCSLSVAQSNEGALPTCASNQSQSDPAALRFDAVLCRFENSDNPQPGFAVGERCFCRPNAIREVLDQVLQRFFARQVRRPDIAHAIAEQGAVAG